MSKLNLAIVGILLITVSLACKSFMPGKSAITSRPSIDFTKPVKGLDVKVDLDKNQTASGKVSPTGGSVTLTAADGSKFTLDVPANAVEAETTITMTAVKSIEGAPLDSNSPTAVQLEPSGLFFKEFVTLTVVPSKDIPVKNQIAFGYEGGGKDYHLAPVDPKSKDIKIKLISFSGAGVASGSDAAWAAHLMIDASSSSTRLIQKLGEITQADRSKVLSGEGEGASMAELVGPFVDAFMDQVVLKEMAAAELDCKHAQQALDDLNFVERAAQLAGLNDPSGSRGYDEKKNRLLDIGRKCRKSYHVEGSSNGASFKGDICSLDKPFTIDVDSKTGEWPMNFTPESESAGRMEGTFSSNGCTLTGGGPYTISIAEGGSGTITFTYNSTATCPYGNQTTSRTSTLPLKPAPDLKCN